MSDFWDTPLEESVLDALVDGERKATMAASIKTFSEWLVNTKGTAWMRSRDGLWGRLCGAFPGIPDDMGPLAACGITGRPRSIKGVTAEVQMRMSDSIVIDGEAECLRDGASTHAIWFTTDNARDVKTHFPTAIGFYDMSDFNGLTLPEPLAVLIKNE